jgi:hypothetical protein
MVRKKGIRRGEDGGYGINDRKRDERWLQKAPGIYKKLFTASQSNPNFNPMRERFITKWQQVAYRVEGGGGSPFGNKRR